MTEPAWLTATLAALNVLQTCLLAYMASRSKQRRSEDQEAASGRSLPADETTPSEG